MSDQKVEQAIEQALQRQPAVVVPADFAQRVRSQLPLAPPTSQPLWLRMSASRLAGVTGLAALLAAFCWLAPGARPDFTSLRFDLELIVLAEMAAVGWWVGKDAGLGDRP